MATKQMDTRVHTSVPATQDASIANELDALMAKIEAKAQERAAKAQASADDDAKTAKRLEREAKAQMAKRVMGNNAPAYLTVSITDPDGNVMGEYRLDPKVYESSGNVGYWGQAENSERPVIRGVGKFTAQTTLVYKG